MDYFGINSTEDLPKIKEVLADQIVEATVIKPEDFTDNGLFEQLEAVAQEERENEEAPNTEEETGDYNEGEIDAADADDSAPEQPEQPA